MKVNEATLRSQVLVPYLHAIGFAPQDVEIEKTLRLRLGRSVHELRTDDVQGRADVVVRDSEGRNILVVELKSPGSPLTDDDRDQAISYARLLTQIAPVVLLTNGSESRLFDSITRELIPEDELSERFRHSVLDGQLPSTEDISLRWEALQRFVGYSARNVQVFSQSHLQSRLRALSGSAEDGKVFAPELYVRREGIRARVSSFLAGSDTVLVLAGDSGTGKTNEMCSLSLDLSESHVVLFFLVRDLPTGPAEAVLDSFNWGFSEHLDAPELVRRISGLARTTSRPVILLFDGLDEAIDPSFPQRLSQFAIRLRETNGAVRLVLSVKSLEWTRFARVRDTPSGLQTVLDDSEDRLNADPFLVDSFSEQELTEAEKKYRDVFQLSGLPQGQLRNLCRVPFFLRVVGETYAKRRDLLPTDVTQSVIARNWIDRKMSRMADPDRARRLLHIVGQSILDAASAQKGRQSWDHRIETANLLDLSEPASDELFTHGVLACHQDAEGRPHAGFVHSRIRDYYLSRHVLRLDQLSAEEFGNHVPLLSSNYVLQGALAWHLREAPRSHTERMSEIIRGRAAVFLSTYSTVLDGVVPGLRAALDPYTDGQIGLGYRIGDGATLSYGLYPVGAANVDLLTEFDRDSTGDDLFRLNGHTFRTGSESFANVDPEFAAAEFALTQIHEALDTGSFDETASATLTVEAVLAIVYEYRELLGLPCDRSSEVPISMPVSLDVHDLSHRLQRYYGREHYTRMWIDEQVRSKSEFVSFSGSGRSYSVRVDPNAANHARARADLEANEGATFRSSSIAGQEDLELLPELLAQLIQAGIDRIESPLLPAPDASMSSRFIDSYTDDGIAKILQAFFATGLAAYRELVTCNLAGLTHKLRLYNNYPCTVVASFERTGHPLSSQSMGRVAWAVCHTDEPTEDVVVLVNPAEPLFRFDRSSTEARLISTTGHDPDSYTVQDLRGLLCPDYPSGFGRFGNDSRSAQHAPIRAFAYSQLKTDLESVKPSDLLRSRESKSARPAEDAIP